MNKLSQAELFFYAAVYAFFAIAFQMYCKELGKEYWDKALTIFLPLEAQPRHSEHSHETKLILWGFRVSS